LVSRSYDQLFDGLVNRLKDIWWLVWGVFLVAIVERGNILDEEKKWFDMFRVLFELVSAFGGIGLSLGLPSVSHFVSFYRIAPSTRSRTIIPSWGLWRHCQS